MQLRSLARKLFTKYMAGGDAASITPAIERRQRRQLKMTLFGTCQIELLMKAVSDAGQHRIRHMPISMAEHAPMPDALADDDLVVASIPLRTLLSDASGQAVPASDMVFARLSSAAEAAELLAACERLLDRFVARLAAQYRQPVFFMSFFEPSFNYAGDLLDPFTLTAPRQFIRKLNEAMANSAQKHGNCYYLESNDILNAIGKRYLHDDIILQGSHASFINDWDFKLDTRRLSGPRRLFSAAKFERAIGEFATLFMNQLETAFAVLNPLQQIKLIICDLDDTLWRGVAAEADDISDDDRIEGWPLGLIEALLVFKARGGILALCSKNELEGTKERFKRIFRGALTFDDFAIAKVNWEPKSANIAEILRETNLLARNALFIDDNVREVSEVKRRHPELRCLGTDHYNWRRIVLQAPETQVAVITAESAQRTELVRAAAQRLSDAASLATSPEDRKAWLESLQLKQSVELVAGPGARHYDRAFELINKTNQFNTNGKRWNAAEFQRFLRGGGRCLVSSLRDASVDNGIISVCLIEGDEIVQMVLSCRVFGLGAETAVAASAVDLILAEHEMAVGRIVDTGRNAACHDFFRKLGFAETEGRFEIRSSIERPTHIEITQAPQARRPARVAS